MLLLAFLLRGFRLRALGARFRMRPVQFLVLRLQTKLINLKRVQSPDIIG